MKILLLCQLKTSLFSSEFIDTAVTENDWVCDLEMRATDLYTLGNVGLILGTAVFSALADYKGRRLAFYVATAFMIVFQLIQIGVSHIYPLFVTMKVSIIYKRIR
jgi:MFS family permease